MRLADFRTLISAQALAALDGARVRLFDCRFDLQDPTAGAAQFQAGHIPSAIYLDLERDLAGPVTPGRTGRHPLPKREAFARLLRSHGVDETTQVIAYDASSGLFAARLWWMARWAGHIRVAVLDGGFQAWLEWRGGAVPASGRDGADESPSAVSSADIGATAPPAPVTMQAMREHAGAWTLLDARAADRFRGENETLDSIAGHIPGALSVPFQDNLAPDGRFLSRATLRARFERLLANRGEAPAVCYCGSGVSAAHNILAFVHAGLAEPALYPGSWSEWITDPANPIET